MALYTIEQLLSAPTVDDVKRSIYSALTAMGVTTTNWKPGAVVRTMIAACAIVLAGLALLITFVARSGFLSLSEGAWKKLVAKYVYGVDYLEATFAIGSVTVTNASGGIFNYAAGELTFRNTETGALYVNQGAISIPIGTPTPSVTTFTVQAVEVGSAGSALPGQIAEIVPPILDVSVNNADAIVGRDEETDSELDARAGEKLGSLSPNGPWDAYSYVAKSVTRADGSNIGISRVTPVKDGNGHATVYLATPSGGVSGTVGDLNTDLGLVDDEIQRKCVPLGFTATTASATTRAVDGAYTAWIYNTSGAKLDDIITAINAEIATRLGATPIGGDKLPGFNGGVHAALFSDAISRTKVKGAPLQVIRTAATVVAAPDISFLPLAFNEAPIFGNIVGNVVQVSPPGSA